MGFKGVEIFENDFLPDDAYKIMLCRICSANGVDFVKTSKFQRLKGNKDIYCKE